MAHAIGWLLIPPPYRPDNTSPPPASSRGFPACLQRREGRGAEREKERERDPIYLYIYIYIYIYICC